MEIMREKYNVVHLTDGADLYKAIDLVNSGKANGINFNFIRNFIPSIENIYNCPGIKHLQINHECDFSIINNLEGLESLSLLVKPNETIDFSRLKNLKRVCIYWHNKYKSIFECENLEHLFLGKYKANDLASLKNLRNLTYFRLNTGSVCSLNGIEALSKLRQLYLILATKLVSLEGVGTLSQLELLYIDACKNITEYQGVFELPSSTKIVIGGSSNINLSSRGVST
jgi:hypothetical protein